MRLLKELLLQIQKTDKGRLRLMSKVNIGDTIKIIHMEGESQYKGREGVVTHIDDVVVLLLYRVGSHSELFRK